MAVARQLRRFLACDHGYGTLAGLFCGEQGCHGGTLGCGRGPGSRSVAVLASVPAALAAARGTVISRKRELVHPIGGVARSSALRPGTSTELGAAVPHAGHPSWPEAQAFQVMLNQWLTEVRGFVIYAGLHIVA